VAAKLAGGARADKVIFLTDVDGLYADFSDKRLAHQRAHARRGRGDDRVGMRSKEAWCPRSPHAFQRSLSLRGQTGSYPQRHVVPTCVVAARGVHRLTEGGRYHDRADAQRGVDGSDIRRSIAAALDAQYVMQTLRPQSS